MNINYQKIQTNKNELESGTGVCRISAIFPNFFDKLPTRYKKLKKLKNILLQVSENRIDIYNNNDKVGSVEMTLHKKPFKYYMINDLTVNSNFLNQGYGDLLIEVLNSFLTTNNVVGILINGVDIDNVKNSYQRFYLKLFLYINHGWEVISEVEGVPYYMILNPTGVNTDKLKKMFMQ